MTEHREPHERPVQHCPRCAETILAEAKVCRYCGAKLELRAWHRKSLILVPAIALLVLAVGGIGGWALMHERIERQRQDMRAQEQAAADRREQQLAEGRERQRERYRVRSCEILQDWLAAVPEPDGSLTYLLRSKDAAAAAHRSFANMDPNLIPADAQESHDGFEEAFEGLSDAFGEARRAYSGLDLYEFRTAMETAKDEIDKVHDAGRLLVDAGYADC